MSKQIRVNVKSRLAMNAADITSRTIEGKEHVIISGAKHMIADSVMNGILYTSQDTVGLAEQLMDGHAFIPAPAEHPIVNGGHVSASDPRALIQHNVGAMHFNFRMEQPGGRLVSDVAIDPDVAYRSDRGRELMKRIELQQPVDMSTGFFLRTVEQPGVANNGEAYDRIAQDLTLDHSALLIESPGAKTSDEGVGLFANSLKGEKIELVTCDLDAAKEAVKAEDEKAPSKQGWIEKVLNSVKCALSSQIAYNQDHEQQKTNVSGDTDIMKEKILAALNAAGVKIEGLDDDALLTAYNSLQAEPVSDSVDVSAAVAEAIKPLADQLAAVNARLDAGKDNQKKADIETVVNSDKYKELTAEMLTAMPETAVAALAANCKSAMGVNSAFVPVAAAAEDTLPE